jgi:DNA-binding LacI/PurR family transcriptional regulator
MCEKAVDILVDRIKRKRRSARLYTVEPELVIRGSTGPCTGASETEHRTQEHAL